MTNLEIVGEISGRFFFDCQLGYQVSINFMVVFGASKKLPGLYIDKSTITFIQLFFGLSYSSFVIIL